MSGSPILVVDDDPAILGLVESVLDMQGYAVSTAKNGAEALGVVERSHPGLILLDMRMPIMDGWDFADELRRRGIDLPIIVMTAAQDAQQWCDEIGATACLPKPFDLDDLLGTVERLIEVEGGSSAAA